MSVDDDGPPTKPNSGSFSVYRDEAARASTLLESLVFIMSKRPDIRDPKRMAAMSKLARELSDLSDAFAAWPMLPERELEKDRATRVPALMVKLREALGHLESIPTHGALGKVRVPKF